MSYMEISNIEKAFDKNEVLKGISLNIEQGEFAWAVRMRKIYTAPLSVRS